MTFYSFSASSGQYNMNGLMNLKTLGYLFM
jgi:hypothetical protein